MQASVEYRPGSVAALTITLEPADIAARIERLFQQHAQRVRIPGFRPGKAPRRLLEERINPESLRMEAIEELIDINYKASLIEQELSPLERGEIEDLTPNDDGSVKFVVVVTVRPKVTLPDYEILAVSHDVTHVTDEQVEAQIADFREHSADYQDVTDEGIQTGDYVTIDYTMTVNGQSYPEGDATGYPLEVGTDTFFPELNEGLLGKIAGETAPLAVTYAKDYSNPDLAGKTAEFAITVQQVRRRVIPEADDAWAQFVTGGQAQTLSDLRDIVRENLRRSAAESDKETVRAALASQLVEGSTLDLPEVMVEEEYEHLMQRLQHELSHQHRLTLEDYANMTDTSVETLQNERRILARDFVRRSLVLQEVARRENLTVNDDELDMLVRMVAMSSGESKGELSKKELARQRKELEKSGQMDHLASRLLQEKIYGFLESKARITLNELSEIPASAETTAQAPARKKKTAAGAALPEEKPKAKRTPKKKAAVEGEIPITGADEAPAPINTEGAE